MQPGSARSPWEDLRAKAHLPEVQALIHAAITRGEIRVAPAPGGGICIIPAGGTGPVARSELVMTVGPGLEKDHRRAPVLRVGRRSR